MTVRAEEALREAEVAERQLKSGTDLGPLHGLPISLKDNFETAGVLTMCGSKLMEGYTPGADCEVLRRLKARGAVLLGKLNTHEFAIGGTTPPTRNPWNLDAIPGGSSGGPGAAIAASSAILALGTDTGGSIRVPASFCGVVGLKPTYGRVSRAGVVPLSWSLDHVGPMTRRIEDTALLLSAIAGQDDSDPTSATRPLDDYLGSLRESFSGATIGLPKNHFFDHCDRDVAKGVHTAVDVLRELGCTVTEFEFPLLPEIAAAMMTISGCEATAYHERNLAERPAEMAPDSREFLERNLFIPATRYIHALRARSSILPRLVSLFRNFDAVATPTTALVAPPVGTESVTIEGRREKLGDALARFTLPFNLLGFPAISLPCGLSHGLPIGMQLIGSPWRESTLLRVANAYEGATDWHTRSPPSF